jgi:hypothetical protein
MGHPTASCLRLLLMTGVLLGCIALVATWQATFTASWSSRAAGYPIDAESVVLRLG